jgi:hypothetical protein
MLLQLYHRNATFVSFLLRNFQTTDIRFWPVKGMQLVMELEQDLKVANVICKVISHETSPLLAIICTFLNI